MSPTLFSACVYRLYLEPFVDETTLAPLNNFGILVKKQWPIDVWVYIWAINYITFVYMSNFKLILYCFLYYSFLVTFETRKCESSNPFSSQYCFGYAEPFAIRYRFENGFSISPKRTIGISIEIAFNL